MNANTRVFLALLGCQVEDPTSKDKACERVSQKRNMRRLLANPNISPLPWRVSTCEDEPSIVCIADANDQIVAKFGPISHSGSSFDAMLIAAMVNGAKDLLDIAARKEAKC
jgi:hypothetical protein